MEIKLARKELSKKPQTISLKKIEDDLKDKDQIIYYFDKDNSHKDLITLIEYFENKGFSVYHRTVKYGLDENDYMYEVHIL
ncbi:MAG: hypothetical protein MR902_08500 [Campylobacter sp.]|nr:hypothetical protein [Campylobacter sp.]